MIHYLYLGRVDYGEALRLQNELVAMRQADRIGNVLLLLEHPPVLTLGRNASRSNILASDELLTARGVTLYEINRGGDVTYHGPGQLIGYPIFDLRSLRNTKGNRLGPVDFVRQMEEALIHLCADFGVRAGRICGLTGVWCGLSSGSANESPLLDSPQSSPEGLPCAAPAGRGRKIAAIGIHVARGVTSHGFAFNFTTDLRDFTLINPCGITDRPVTSLQMELAGEVGMEAGEQLPQPVTLPSLESLAHKAAHHFGLVFDEPIEFVEDLTALRALASANSDLPSPVSFAPEFPANDAPLEIPPEIERLRHKKDRPVSA
ncbi:MAG TPA: lipoyl(octanoyl) transferase LipB [Terracidiphilus sp.]|jgi:lipoyl(octanoyl) transferase